MQFFGNRRPRAWVLSPTAVAVLLNPGRRRVDPWGSQADQESVLSISSLLNTLRSHLSVRAQAAAAPSAPVLPYRVGHGFDLHRLAEGYKLIIGGVDIPHTKGCEAHSDGGHGTWVLQTMQPITLRRCERDYHGWADACDAVRFCAGDVLLHTVTDAILGALCLPDIGEPWHLMQLAAQ